MLRKLNATRTGSAKAGEYHIRYQDGQYKVYDKASRFRLGFATLNAAQTYITLRSGPHAYFVDNTPEAQPAN